MPKEVELYKVGGSLDASTCNKEQEAIVTLMDRNKSIAIDLSECSYVSSAGLRVLLYSYKLARSKNLQLYLIGVCSEVRDVMKMTGFEKFFVYFGTVDECINQ